MPGGFVVGIVAVGQVLLLTPRFPPPPVCIIPPATAAVQAYKYTSHWKKKFTCLIILTLLSFYLKTGHGTRDLPAVVSEWCCLLCIFRKVTRVEDFAKQHTCIRAGSCLLLTDRRANLVTKLRQQWETMRCCCCCCLSAESPGLPFLRTRKEFENQRHPRVGPGNSDRFARGRSVYNRKLA